MVDLGLGGPQASPGDASGNVLIDIENLLGSAHDDQLTGDAFANVIDGANGNDTIEGRGGADQLDGGAGSDTVSYLNSTLGVTVDLSLAGAQVSAGEANGDVLVNFENLSGSTQNDSLTGDGNANTIDGDAGDDLIHGGGGIDTLQGGLGSDTLYGDAGDDNLLGGEGEDTLYGGAGADTLDGGLDDDTVTYSDSTVGVTVNLSLAGAQVSAGDANGDVISNVERLEGSAFDDTLTGDSGDNAILGGDGNDTLVGGLGADVIDGGAGTDVVTYAAAAAGVGFTLDGVTSSAGEAAGDVITNVENGIGSAFDDIIGGSSVANVLDGGADIDAVTYANAPSAVTVDLSLATQVGTSWENGDQLLNFENVIGTVYNDTLRGDSGDNELEGGAGDDVLDGRAGGDFLLGGSGDATASYENATGGVSVDLRVLNGYGGEANGDAYNGIEKWLGSAHGDYFWMSSGVTEFDGAGGTDTADYYYSTAAVTIDLNLSTAQGGGGYGAGDILSNIEVVRGSRYYGDTLTGSGANEWLYGLDGDDVLSGGGGNDWLRGDRGVDTIDGGAGDDWLDLRSEYYSELNQSATIYLDGTACTGTSDAAGDTVVGIERVYGSDAWETVVATTGFAQFNGNNGEDTIDFSASLAGITVDLTVTTAQTSGGLASGTILQGVENIVGTGFDDTLTGNGSENDLYGGGGGADSFSGGGGNDAFFVTAAQAIGGGANLVAADGGTGYDALRISGLTGGATIDLSQVVPVSSSLEEIDIRGGTDQTLNISAADVQSLVGQGTASLLTLRVDFGDVINVTDPYVDYTAGGATIFSDVGKTVQIAQLAYVNAAWVE
ncbi:MAG: hypothetical protein R3E48_10600 [Burkholderiaceae bacterium]